MHEIHRDDRAGAAAATGPGREDSPGSGIAQCCRLDGKGQAAPHHGSSPFELIDREIDPLSQQRPQRAFHPVLRYEMLKVPVLAPGESEQRAIGARRVIVDRVLHQGEEVRLAALQPALESAHRFLDREAVAKERRETPEASERP